LLTAPSDFQENTKQQHGTPSDLQAFSQNGCSILNALPGIGQRMCPGKTIPSPTLPISLCELPTPPKTHLPEIVFGRSSSQ